MPILASVSQYLADRASAAVNQRIAGMIASTLADAGVSAQLSVDFRGRGWPLDLELTRDGDSYRVSYSSYSNPNVALSLARYAAAYLFWFIQCPPSVERMTVNLSDGDDPSLARFTASSRFSNRVPIPDPYFFRDRGFANERALASATPEWSRRSETVTWRGALTGIGKLEFDLAAMNSPLVLSRLRLCMLMNDHQGFDVRLSTIPAAFNRWVPVFASQGVIGEPVEEASWIHRKYAIDIDGFSNTWSNLFIRMLFGCCIFKVDSQMGFRQWYYDRIRPFEHYVPVRSDLSNLVEQVDWARSHDAEARAIGENAQRFAMGLDFEAGKRDAMDIISAHWNTSGP